jgi:feruloyl esterase
MLRSYLAIGVLILVPSLGHGQTLSSQRCERLASLTLPNTAITMAEVNTSGTFVPSGVTTSPNANLTNLPPFCRVAATLRPSSGSDISIEVWMSLANWNGKFQGVGNGGFAGSITYTSGNGGIERGMAEALKRGYATASTDTGHTADAVPAFLGHPEKLVDFGHRAVHEMTVAAKAIVAAFYGTGPKLSYWNGCSTGGRQGLMEAQRFPTDYDGIIAGAPANPQTRLAAWNIHVGQAALKNPANTIPPSKYPMIHRAVLNTCDALDGLADGLISEPDRCSVDFKALECKGEDSASCLTAAQLATAQTVTNPAVHSKTRETIFPGLALGSELGWTAKIGGPAPNSLGTDYFRYVVFKDPNWDWRTFDLETAVALADRIDNGITNATSPDLAAFTQRGGKLLLYHGWRDQNFSAQSTINYYRSVIDRTGSGRTADSLRLFLVPGMGHCGGGEGLNAFDAVAALEEWVEQRQPPTRIVASRRTDGKVERTRPLCPYPQVARYTGTGSIDDAANFVCRAPDGN